MGPIQKLRQRVRARVRGEEPAGEESSWEALLSQLGVALQSAEPHAVAAAFYRLDEYKAAAVAGDLAAPPLWPAVSEPELGVLLARLDLTDTAWDEALRMSLELPDSHGQLALRLTVGLLDCAPQTARTPLAAVLSATRRWLPDVFSPYGRWLLTNALAALCGDGEEQLRAAEQYRRSGWVTLRSRGSGILLLDGYPHPGDSAQPWRVAPGPHLAALCTSTVTRLERFELAPGQSRQVRLQANLLAAGWEPLVAEHDRLTDLPVRIRGEVDGAEMVYVPPGGFEMGWRPNAEEPARAGVSKQAVRAAMPAREVELHGFYIDLRPASSAIFRRFLQRGGYANRAYWSEHGWEAHHGPENIDRLSWEQWIHKDGRRRPPLEPITHLTWHEAQACARWSGKRLPTEAEWERALLYLGARTLHLSHAEWCADTYRAGYEPGDVADPFVDGDEQEPKVIRGVLPSYHGDAVIARARAEADPLERLWSLGFRTVYVP